MVVPPGPVAVKVYVVVVVGLTEVVVLGPKVPTPLLIETLVTFVVVQVSVDEFPLMIDAGLAVKLLIVGAGSVTVTVTVAVVVPPGPVAVKVYVVVVFGVTEVEPLGPKVPTPLLIETLVTFVVVQVNVDEFPLMIAAGEAVKLLIVGDG